MLAPTEPWLSENDVVEDGLNLENYQPIEYKPKISS